MEPALEEVAACIAAVVKAELPTNCPTLKGLIHVDVGKTTKELCRCVQSLEAKLSATTTKCSSTAKKWGGRLLKEQGWPSHCPSKNTKATRQEVDNGQEETGSPRGCKETFSCRQQQCFQCRLKKSKEGLIQAQVNWERVREENRCLQLMRAAEWWVRLCFGFLPNLALSIHKNAQQVSGDTREEVVA